MKKKVLIYISEIIWTRHIGTGLEIIQNHLDIGDDVVNISCNAHFKYCDQNLSGSDKICSICINKRIKSLNLLNKKINEIIVEFPIKNYNYAKYNNTLEEVKNIYHNGYDVGMAVCSSLISRSRDCEYSVEDNINIINNLINRSSGFYDFIIDTLNNEKPDLVYIFNGRYTYDRALLRASEKLNIEYVVYDGDSNINKYITINNRMIHDIDKTNKEIIEIWDSSHHSINEKNIIGKEYYHNKRYKKDKNETSFIKNQKTGILPKSWNHDITNIVVFLTTEHEFAAISDQWKMPFYKNQLDGVESIVNEFIDKNHNIKFYIRIHPNSLNTSNAYFSQFSRLSNHYVEIIDADSTVSSYDLLMSAKKVITFGSAMGIEASYWKKPSINVGMSYYQFLDVTHNPSNHQETIKYILNTKLEHKNKIEVIKYGYYMMNRGRVYKYYKSIDNKNGIFKNSKIYLYNLNKYNRYKEHVKNIMPEKIIKSISILKSKIKACL